MSKRFVFLQAARAGSILLLAPLFFAGCTPTFVIQLGGTYYDGERQVDQTTETLDAIVEDLLSGNSQKENDVGRDNDGAGGAG